MLYDNFDDWPEEKVLAFMADNRILSPRKLADGTWAGICELMYTTSVCMDVTPLKAFAYRWCFEYPAEAFHFLATAQDFDEVPARKTSLKGHRYITQPLYMEQDALGLNKW